MPGADATEQGACETNGSRTTAPPSASSLTREARALRIAALLATAAIIWVAHPIAIGVLLGMLTAFTLLPLYRRLYSRTGKPWLAALSCVLLTLLGAMAALAGFGYLIVDRGIVLARQLPALLHEGGSLRSYFDQLSAHLPRFGIHAGSIIEKIGSATTEISVRLASMASLIAGTTVSLVLGIFFLLLTCYYVLPNWATLTRHAELMLPLNPRHTRALFDEFRRVGRSVVLGTVLTGIAQGALAGLGYWFTRVPDAAFFGALTAVASLLPAVGTLLIWVPIGIYLLGTGHPALGIVELLYGLTVVVGFCDYVLRPRLVGASGELPALLTLIALFGGLNAMGLIGLLLGPVLMSLSVALLRIYEREAAAPPSVPVPVPVPMEHEPLPDAGRS